MTAGIDLCLHIVRKDLGAAIANIIARELVAAPHPATAGKLNTSPLAFPSLQP